MITEELRQLAEKYRELNRGQLEQLVRRGPDEKVSKFCADVRALAKALLEDSDG